MFHVNKTIYLLFGLISFTSSSLYADFNGVVQDVRDGGVILVNTDGRDVLVKLDSIVTAFPNQNAYSNSRTVFERVFLNKEVTVLTSNNLNDSCIFGEVLSNGANLNEALLMTGYAWVLSDNAPAKYMEIENFNRINNIGLFNPDLHFQFSSISFPVTGYDRSCLIKNQIVPIDKQYDFNNEANKYGFLYSLKCIFAGLIGGLLIWKLIFFIDGLGIEFNIFDKFKKKNKGD